MERSPQSTPMVHLLVCRGCSCLHGDIWHYNFCDGLYDDEIYMADSEAGSGCCSFSADLRLSAVMSIPNLWRVFLVAAMSSWIAGFVFNWQQRRL